MAWNVMEQLNKNAQKAAVGDETPKARFRTKDINIKKLYSNDKNFYSVTDIEPLAQKILLVGLIENLEVVHDPCDRGEYRITAGERRWRALKLLVEQGYTDFEMVTCQIQTPASADEEMLRLIIANDYRNKTVADILEEEKQLKDILQRMKQEGRTIKGYKLDSGRLRDVATEEGFVVIVCFHNLPFFQFNFEDRSCFMSADRNKSRCFKWLFANVHAAVHSFSDHSVLHDLFCVFVCCCVEVSAALPFFPQVIFAHNLHVLHINL